MFLSRRIFSFLLFFMGNSFFIIAQNKADEPGNWIMFFNQVRFHKSMSSHAEIQYRSYSITPNTEQLLIRAGLNFHYNPGMVFTAGYGWIGNYLDEEEISNTQIVNESRLWEQIMLRNNTGRLFLEHRYRFEQRWIEKNKTVSHNNRIRYLLRMTIPVNHAELKKRTLFVSFYDELFININNSPFDRNRLYGAIGFQFISSANIQLGYMLQTVGNKSKQYLQIGINYNPDLRRKNEISNSN